MPQRKTEKNRGSVKAFLDSIEDPARRKDCRAIAAMMREATGARAAMWGTSVVGFGRYRYLDAAGREQAWFLVGFSPRAQSLTLYVLYGLTGVKGLLKRLGPHTTGKSCLYIKRLDDVDTDVLRELIERAVASKRARSH